MEDTFLDPPGVAGHLCFRNWPVSPEGDQKPHPAFVGIIRGNRPSSGCPTIFWDMQVEHPPQGGWLSWEVGKGLAVHLDYRY